MKYVAPVVHLIAAAGQTACLHGSSAEGQPAVPACDRGGGDKTFDRCISGSSKGGPDSCTSGSANTTPYTLCDFGGANASLCEPGSDAVAACFNGYGIYYVDRKTTGSHLKIIDNRKNRFYLEYCESKRR